MANNVIIEDSQKESISDFNTGGNMINKKIRVSMGNNELKKNLLPPINNNNKEKNEFLKNGYSPSKFSKKYTINSQSDSSNIHTKTKSIAGDIRSILRKNNSANHYNQTKHQFDGGYILPSCVQLGGLTNGNNIKVNFFVYN